MGRCYNEERHGNNIYTEDAAMDVRKRSGILAAFDRNKIISAIMRADAGLPETEQLPPEDAAAIADRIEALAQSRETAGSAVLSVEEIQDLIEQELMNARRYQLARRYIIYRYNRAMIRSANAADRSILSLVRQLQAEDEHAPAEPDQWEIPVQAQADRIAAEISRKLTHDFLLPEPISKAHEAGILVFHHAEHFMQPIFDCCLIDIGDMLQNGTVLNGKLIEQPKSFQVACTVLTQILSAAAGGQYGGISVDLRHLGRYLAESREKYCRHFEAAFAGRFDPEELHRLTEDRLADELRSGIQTLLYQLVTLLTVHGASPEITFFLYPDLHDPYLTENVSIIRELFRQRLAGIKNEHGVLEYPEFPRLVYCLDENNNLTGGRFDELTRLAVQCSAKSHYPDYLSAAVLKEKYGAVTPCAGSYHFLPPYRDRTGKLKFEGRMSQGCVSLNLVSAGLASGGDPERFEALLNERLELCREALLFRSRALAGVLSDVSPIHWQHGAIARLAPGEAVTPYLYHGYSTLSLGFAGLSELTLLMTGARPSAHEKAAAFAEQVMRILSAHVRRWSLDAGVSFCLYDAPSAELCRYFADRDRQQYGEEACAAFHGVYTNSCHPAACEFPDDTPGRLAFEQRFQPYMDGGYICFVKVPVSGGTPDLSQMEEIVRNLSGHILYAGFALEPHPSLNR